MKAAGNGRVLYEGRALPHFNEVDECAGLDALVTNRVWTRLGYDPETTLHDVRYGEAYNGEFVWVFEISGSVPPQHLIGGYTRERSASANRECISAWAAARSRASASRARSSGAASTWKADACTPISAAPRWWNCPREETERRWRDTTPQWPIMHAVLYGVSRDQLMAKHKANHIQVAYGSDAAAANAALAAKAAMFAEMGIAVNICGTEHGLAEA